MLSLNKLLPIMTITAVCLLMMTGLVHGEERYIVDTITVTLREGPGPQYKVVKTLQTGQSFDVLETQNEFIRVRTRSGEEGWLQDRYTDTRPPDTILVKDLNEKISLLTAQNEQLSANLANLTVQQSDTSADSQAGKESTEQTSAKESSEVKRLQAELAETTKQFKQLETAAADVLQIMEENDKLKAESSSMQKNMAQLQQANAALADRQEVYWFLAGSGVFFLGWMIGKISFRRQRHQSSLTL